MRPISRAISTAASAVALLAVAGTPLAAQARPLPDHIDQTNVQLVQTERKGSRHKIRSRASPRGSATLSDRRRGKSHLRNYKRSESRALHRNRGKISQDRRHRSSSRRAAARRHGVRHYWGPGALFYFYDGYYHGDCNWLRRKAVATGSRYWWQRHRQCRAS